MIFKKITILFIVLKSVVGLSQTKNETTEFFGHPILSFHYSLNNTCFDWKERFGVFNSVGGNIGYKTKKNWTYTFEGNFLFGNKMNEGDILKNLRDNNGNITDDQGNIAVVPIFTRGYTLGVNFGKIIPLKSRSNNILINAGIGFISYKYRIETNSENVPQLENKYTYGYDRLTQGVLINEFVGYQFVSERNLLNFYIGLYCMQGFNHNVRTIFFDKPEIAVSKKLRIDGSYGVKIGWNVPFFNDKPKEFYYY